MSSRRKEFCLMIESQNFSNLSRISILTLGVSTTCVKGAIIGSIYGFNMIYST